MQFTSIYIQVFSDWSVIINEQFKAQNRQCLMLLDNATSHAVRNVAPTKVGSLHAIKLSNLLLLFLPANCTSVVQPLDQGVIAAFKVRYKCKLAQHMVMQYDINPRQDLRTLSLKTDVKQVNHIKCCLRYMYNELRFLFLGNYLAGRSME